MSVIALHAPSLLPSPREMMWENRRGPELLSRPRAEISQADKVELPSIRQAIPEIDQVRSVRPQRESRPASYSPAALSSHEQPQSQPSSVRKRRRLSAEDDLDTRDHVAARLYRSPPRLYQCPSTTASPRSNSRRASVLSMTESWGSSTIPSPHAAARGLLAISPAFDSSVVARSEWRPQLPGLPALTFDRATVQAPRAPNSWSDYGFDAPRTVTQPPIQQPISPTDATPSYPPAVPYTQQPRGVSYGPSTSHASHSQPSFSTIHSSGFVGYPCTMDTVDVGGNDIKQRKRRGNLPKETTDMLRAWFRENLQHPYPSEEEKQRLMKATGLQMNQISNWFINARRRHLPNMVNSARAEAGARAGAEGKNEDARTDLDVKSEPGEGKRDQGGSELSEGEGTSYDDDYATLGRRRGVLGMVKRESI